MSSKKKITRRLVVGEVCYRMERVATIFPRNYYALPARIEGPKAARALRDLAEVLRTLEEHGPEVAWEELQEMEALDDE